MDLVRDVLDKLLVGDERHEPLGRADGLLAELRDGQPPRVIAIELGFPALARRVHPRLERWVRALGRRFGVRRGRVFRVPWRRVRKVEVEIEVARVDPDRSPATAWERWLREHVTRHIPGSGA
jgi:hypothetical protein